MVYNDKQKFNSVFRAVFYTDKLHNLTYNVCGHLEGRRMEMVTSCVTQQGVEECQTFVKQMMNLRFPKGRNIQYSLMDLMRIAPRGSHPESLTFTVHFLSLRLASLCNHSVLDFPIV